MESDGDHDYLNLKFEDYISKIISKDGKWCKVSLILNRNHTVFSRSQQRHAVFLQKAKDYIDHKHMRV